MINLSIDTKLDIILIMFGIWLFVFVGALTYRIKKYLSGGEPERVLRQVRELDNQGEYSQLLEFCDSFLERQPNNVDLLWAKARATFKLGKRESALKLFNDLKIAEPMWSEDAEKYIAAINIDVGST